MKIFAGIKFFAVIAIPFCSVTSVVAAESYYTDGVIERSLVFDMGDFGSKFYRIPALVTAADGTLVAIADRRFDSIADLPGKIDVVARRSVDGGRTWGDCIVVAEHDSIGGYGDPAVVVDRRTGDIIVISTHGNGLWQATPGHISVSRSKDNGKTWLPAVDINEQLFAPSGKIAACSAFASSGNALQLSDGRLMFALVTRQKGVEGFPVYAVYSDDGGQTWAVSENPATLNGDESKVVQLADGSLIMSVRNRYGGQRIFSYSNDRGRTWSEPRAVADLPCPACNGDLIRYSRDGYELLLQSLPAPYGFRQDVTIYVSDDHGASWKPDYRVVRAPSAYSSMTVLPDGSIGILTEEGVHDCGARQSNGYRIWFTRIPITLLTK